MDTHRARRLPVGDARQIKAQDIKLWECDKVQAHASRQERYHCPYKICPCACPLKRSTTIKHLQDFGQHPCNKGWTEVCLCDLDMINNPYHYPFYGHYQNSKPYGDFFSILFKSKLIKYIVKCIVIEDAIIEYNIFNMLCTYIHAIGYA